MKRLGVLVLSLLLLMVAAPASADTSVLATFSGADEHPESVAVGPDGSVHVGLHASGRIWHRLRSGAVLVTQLPTPGRANGIAVAPSGIVSVAMLSSEPSIAGIWAGRPGSRFRRIAALPVTASPNGMSADALGNLYVADDAAGLIWRVRAGRATVWVRSPLLARKPGGTPYGANGTEIHHGVLYVTNPSQTSLVAVPLHHPSSLRVVRQAPVFADVDDFDIRPDGTLVVARIFTGTVELLHRDGRTTVLASGLAQPTAVTLGRGVAYVTNAAFSLPAGSASVLAIPLR